MLVLTAPSIPGGPGDAATVRLDALTLAFHALVVRLMASGSLASSDVAAMREFALKTPGLLEASPFSSVQVGGGRLAEAVERLFDRLDGTSW